MPKYGWYFWGAEEGRGSDLGQNQQTPDFIPTEVIDISAGSRHTFLIEADGTAVAAGFVESKDSYIGHLGLGPVETAGCPNEELLCEGTNPPLPVEEVVNAAGDTEPPPPFVRAYAGIGVASDSGEMHSLLISRDGKAYVSGSNNKGQLCLGESAVGKSVDTFHEVPGINNAIQGAVGIDFTLILTADGKVYGCGTNDVGQIGQGPDIPSVSEPVLIQGLNGIDDLATGLTFSMFLDRDEGKIYGTGSNLYGQLCGFTSGAPQLTPKVRCHSQFLHLILCFIICRYLNTCSIFCTTLHF